MQANHVLAGSFLTIILELLSTGETPKPIWVRAIIYYYGKAQNPNHVIDTSLNQDTSKPPFSIAMLPGHLSFPPPGFHHPSPRRTSIS